MTEVLPRITTTVLPFGLSEDGGSFRFSVCIDLVSSYADDTKPIYENLLIFLLRYGIQEEGKESIHQNLVKGLEFSLISESSEETLTGRACFQEAFGNVRKYWTHLLYSGQTERIGNISTKIPERKVGAYQQNDIAKTPIELFLKKDTPNPHAIVEKLISSFGKADSLESQQLYEEISEGFNQLTGHLEDLNDKLSGIDRFSFARNQSQSFKLFERIDLESGNKHIEEYYSTDRILTTFSFLDGNFLLQRLFGTVIDFEIDAKAVRDLLPVSGKFSLRINDTKGLFNQILTDEATNLSLVSWEHLVVPMEYISISGKGEVILVQRDTEWSKRQSIYAENYDKGSKLKSLTALRERLGEFEENLKKAPNESSRQAIVRELIKIDSLALTRGMNLYFDDLDQRFGNMHNPTQPITTALIEKEITRGHRYAILNSKGNGFISLGSRKVELKDEKNLSIPLPKAFQSQQFAAHADTAMHSLQEEIKDGQPTGILQPILLVDNAILTWSGENIGFPSLFSNPEDETNLPTTENEGSVSDATDIVTKTFLKFYNEVYFPRSVTYKGTIKNRHRMRGEEAIQIDEEVPKPVTIKYMLDINAKLLLGRKYQSCYVPEYKNGWGVEWNGKKNDKGRPIEIGAFDFLEAGQNFIPFEFKRNEPVKPVALYLKEPLRRLWPPYPRGPHQQNIAADGREGESLHHMVIRNYSKNPSDITRTKQESFRYIVPPSISFEHAFWHDQIFSMPREDSYKWYRKYHFPVAGSEVNSIEMQEFYLDDLRLNYLPDPLTKGFRMEFFSNKTRTHKAEEYREAEQLEFYFSGTYPKINAWRLILKEEEAGKPWVSYKNEQITIRIRKGEEIFATIRTILHERYENELETFGNYNEYTRFGANDLLTPPLHLSFVHAVQRPLLTPTLQNVLRCHKDMGRTGVTLQITAWTEQLGTYLTEGGIRRFEDDSLPTGRLDLFAKWEEYIDDPSHLLSEEDNWTPDKPVNMINTQRFYPKEEGETAPAFESTVEWSEEQLHYMEASMNKIANDSHEAKNFATDLTFTYDVRSTKYLEKWCWLKNKSKFTSYYPAGWGQEDEQKEGAAEKKKDIFNRISSTPLLVTFLNNCKPLPPKIAARGINLVAVTEDITNGTQFKRTTRMNRLRFYFERGRFSSGKGERIGFVINDPTSPYNDYFIENGMVGAVGKDILSDVDKPFDGMYRSEKVFLQISHFVLTDPYDLKDTKGNKTDDLESFLPQYIPQLGLITFAPKIDKTLNLWYFDVELDINNRGGKELHSPFLQFSLVNYQAHSIDYNSLPSSANPFLDCRFSEVVSSGFVYIMGSRTLLVDKKEGEFQLQIRLDSTSLKGGPMSKENKFFAVLQQRNENEIRWLIEEGQILHLVLPNAVGKTSISYKNLRNLEYRFLILETEEWGNPNPTSLTSLLNDKDVRIVGVQIISAKA